MALQPVQAFMLQSFFSDKTQYPKENDLGYLSGVIGEKMNVVDAWFRIQRGDVHPNSKKDKETPKAQDSTKTKNSPKAKEDPKSKEAPKEKEMDTFKAKELPNAEESPKAKEVL